MYMFVATHIHMFVATHIRKFVATHRYMFVATHMKLFVATHMRIEQTSVTHICIQVAPSMRPRYMFVATHINMFVAAHIKMFVATHMHIEQICVHESQRTRAFVLQQKCTCVAANMCICVATKTYVHRATSRTHTFSLNYGLCAHSKSFMSAQHI